MSATPPSCGPYWNEPYKGVFVVRNIVKNDSSYDLLFEAVWINKGVVCGEEPENGYSAPPIIPAHSTRVIGGQSNGEAESGVGTTARIRYAISGQEGAYVDFAWDNYYHGDNSFDYHVVGDAVYMRAEGQSPERHVTTSITIVDNPLSACSPPPQGVCGSRGANCYFASVANPSYALPFGTLSDDHYAGVACSIKDKPTTMTCNDFFKHFDKQVSRDSNPTIEQIFGPYPFMNDYDGTVNLTWRGGDCAVNITNMSCMLKSPFNPMNTDLMSACCSGSVTRNCDPNWCPANSITCSSYIPPLLRASVTKMPVPGLEIDLGFYRDYYACNKVGATGNNGDPLWLAQCPNPSECTYNGFARVTRIYTDADGITPLYDGELYCTVSERTYDPAIKDECCLKGGTQCDPNWSVRDPQGECADVYTRMCSSVTVEGRHFLLETDSSKTGGIPCGEWFANVSALASVKGNDNNPSVAHAVAMVDEYCSRAEKDEDCLCYNDVSRCTGGKCLPAVSESKSLYAANVYCKPNSVHKELYPSVCSSGNDIPPALNGNAGFPLECWLPACRGGKKGFSHILNPAGSCPDTCVQYSGGGSLTEATDSFLMMDAVPCGFSATDPSVMVFSSPYSEITITSDGTNMTKKISLTNPSLSGGSIHYSVSTDLPPEIFTITPSEGTVSPSETVKFFLTVQGDSTRNGEHKGVVTFSDTDGVASPTKLNVNAVIANTSPSPSPSHSPSDSGKNETHKFPVVVIAAAVVGIVALVIAVIFAKRKRANLK
jgi:hypothetical protein